MAEGTCYVGGEAKSGIGQAACQAGGGQWVAASETKDDRGFAQRYWEDTSVGGKLFDASMFIPGAGLAGLGIRAGIHGLRNSPRIASLMDKIGGGLKKTYQSTPTMRYADNAANRAKGIVGKKIPVTKRGPNEPPKGAKYNKQKKQWEEYKDVQDPVTKKWSKKWVRVDTKPTTKPVLDAFGRPTYRRGAPQFSPVRAGMTTLGVGGGVVGAGMNTGMIPNQGYNDRMAAINANINKNVMAAQTSIDEQKKTEADAKAEKERVANLDFFERMKEPGYWDKSMSDDPNDTRLMRIAELTAYLGKTPKQRALETNPQDRWSEQAQSDATNQTALLKAQQTLSSPFGKPTVNNLADSLMNKVKEHFGDTWLTFGAEDDQLDAIAKAVAIRITQLTELAPNADPAAIEAEAFRQIDEQGWKKAIA